MGMFSNTDGNLTAPGSWTKASLPVFEGGSTSGLFRIFALSTFKSLDGTEDWITYNASDSLGTEFGERDTFIQKFTWNGDNTPNFGIPALLSTRHHPAIWRGQSPAAH
jgi:GH43 family beta-xylosidase